MQIGDKVKKKRTKLGMRNYQLAKKLGISSSYLSLIENGLKPTGPTKIVLERFINETTQKHVKQVKK